MENDILEEGPGPEDKRVETLLTIGATITMLLLWGVMLKYILFN